jgi:hypothetical protein
VSYKLPDNAGAVDLELFGSAPAADDSAPSLPRYMSEIHEALDRVLDAADLSIWLMVDRLDEIFPRRSDVERRALRGLLRAMRFFSSPRIRVKIFLRDDMLENVTAGGEGFTALTHVTARRADTLRWSQDGILTMIVKRLFTNPALADLLEVDLQRLEASQAYQQECFYRIFPQTVHRGPKQSPTLAWIYNRTQDGRGAVTPRDVIELLKAAVQRQQDEWMASHETQSDWIIGPRAIQHGLEQLSRHKRITYLNAEFPHLAKHIQKFERGKTSYTQSAIKKLLGSDWEAVSGDLVAIGVLRKKQAKSAGEASYEVPHLYRKGLELTQGTAT